MIAQPVYESPCFLDHDEELSEALSGWRITCQRFVGAEATEEWDGGEAEMYEQGTAVICYAHNLLESVADQCKLDADAEDIYTLMAAEWRQLCGRIERGEEYLVNIRESSDLLNARRGRLLTAQSAILISDEAEQALAYYQGQSGYNLNHVLRKRPTLDEFQQWMCDHLDELFAAMPTTTESLVVSREIFYDPKGITSYTERSVRDAYRPGAIVREQAFVSTTMAIGDSAPWEGRAILTIEIPAGAQVVAVDAHLRNHGNPMLQERELLLPRLCQLEIISIDSDEDVEVGSLGGIRIHARLVADAA